jgi:hypothetical protein
MYHAYPWRVGFFINGRASRVFSSHSSYGVFSLTVVIGHLVLLEWSFALEFGCFGILGGLGPVACVGVASWYGCLLYGFCPVFR